MLRPIKIGRDWFATITVAPDPETSDTNSTVTSALTGATATGKLLSNAGATLATFTATITSAANRTITLSLTDTVTTAMSAALGCRVDLYVTLSGGELYDVSPDATVSVVIP